MKGILLLVGVLAFAVSSAEAGTNISINFGGGGYHYAGTSFCATGTPRCTYSAGCIGAYPTCGFAGAYPCYGYGGYGYYYGAYSPAYYPVSYDSAVYTTSYVQPVPAPQPAAPPPAPAPQAAPATPTPAAAPPPAPAPAQMAFGILDVNGFVHSPYSDAIFKVPGVRNAQVVYDPMTGKPFLVR